MVIAEVRGLVKIYRMGPVLVHALRGVYHDHSHVGALHCPHRPQHGIVLDSALHLTRPSYTGRVDQNKGAIVLLEDRIDGVSGRSGYLRDYRAFLTENSVKERRLAHVRPTDDRHLDRVFRVDSLARLFGKRIDDGVQQISHAAPIEGRDRVHLAETKSVELARFAVPRLVVRLVRDHEHRLGRAA